MQDDEIDALIAKTVGNDRWDRVQRCGFDAIPEDLRAVARAAILHERKSMGLLVKAEVEKAASARAALARELLGTIMRDGELPIFRDEREIQMLTKLQSIAGEGA